MSDAITIAEPKKLTKKQKIALSYFRKGLTPRRIAKVLEIKPSRLENWIANNEKFKQEFDKAIVNFEDKDAIYRKRNNTHFLERFNNEIHKRIGKKEAFDDLDLKDLINLAKITAGELRADTPKAVGPDGAGNQVNVNQMYVNIAGRAQKSLSFKRIVDGEAIVKTINGGNDVKEVQKE